MNRQKFYFALICVILMNAVSTDSFAQIENAQDAVGKIYYQETFDPSWTKLFAAQSSVGRNSYYKPLKKYVSEICNAVTDASVVKPPKGFNIKPYISGATKKYDTLYPNRVLPYMNVTFCNYILYTKKGASKVEQAGRWCSSIEVFVNDPEWLLTYDYSIAHNCDSVGIPLFYYKPKTHQDKNGYWIIVPDHIFNEIRIVKKKGVPLYIPLTQREYLEYKLKLHQRSLVSDKAMLATTQKKLQHLEYPSNKPLFEQDIKDENQNIRDDTKAINDYQQALDTWPAEKLNAPAYTSIYYMPGRGENQIDLVAPNYKGATELVRFNRAYFDKTLPAGTPQLILIAAQDDPHYVVPYMAFKVHKWFNQIDYGRLQTMLK